jgi:hypothetical protein
VEKQNTLKFAIGVFLQPHQLRSYKNIKDFGDILHIVKIAAGDEIAARTARDETGYDEEFLREACSFLLQQLLLRPHASDLQLLMLTLQSTPQEAKDHKRWLLKWLHPDRNQNTWQQKLFQRVSEAARRLEALKDEGIIVPIVTVLPAFRSTAKKSSGHLRNSKIPLPPVDYRALLSRWMKQFLVFCLVFIVLLVAISLPSVSSVLPKATEIMFQM